ncbi:HNH endonuclease family protein [Nocardioides sp. R-C-SC26]|uniref:HNH endonuclease family protein n=1 Tax=Nocardioides sp. R-C-SC26 TaxID=2870414 RepID=UPI001E4774A7|nr:HNH endonuclease family protein [Nocardioides sp. R-C-SC26]
MVAALVLVGCSVPDVENDRGIPRAPASISPAEARSRLADLDVVDRRPGGLPPYDRGSFGSSWADVDGNGCNQRDDVLLRDAVPGSTQVQQQGRCPNDVLAGTWIDPYTGATLTFDDLKNPAQAQAIQIDHVVPLSEAWRSGAASWQDDRRRRFANDLANLLAVDGPTNAAKSDDDPAAWRPRKVYQCSFASRWIAVKDAWRLAADHSEIVALEEMLDSCADEGPRTAP